ncbi:MAG: hypothetical protein DLM67_10375 [Candidatus Nephthysia bennettiae]|nr:MAG: hypothetical protein DLM67_10375 [Candidatus Dormibacteraeota bacterium]
MQLTARGRRLGEPACDRGVWEARRGLTTARIAASLGIGEQTVEIHLAHAYAKLGMAGRHEL